MDLYRGREILNINQEVLRASFMRRMGDARKQNLCFCVSSREDYVKLSGRYGTQYNNFFVRDSASN